MAEPHDLAEHPGGAGVPASFPAGPPPAPPPAEEAYRPLSLLALSGFGTAAVYAVVVLLLALVAFRSGKPLILGAWVWFVPLLAGWDCAVAWLRIARSEGTLAGGALARWGLLLAGFVSLSYGAYYVAVNLALRQQAEQFATDWLDQLRQGHLEKALFRTLPPLQRLEFSEDDKDLMGKIALAQGASDEGSAGTMRSRFAQMPVVNLVSQGGKETTIQARGVKGWEFTRGGFEVAVGFHVETPEAEGEIVVIVHGTSAPNGEFAGRQWTVLLDKTGVDQQEGGIRATPFGEKIQQLSGSAFAFLGGWYQKLTNDKREAFLLTFPENQRTARDRALHRALAAGALGGPTAVAAPDLEVLAAYRRFVAGPRSDGGTVEIAQDVTADDSLRKDVEMMVRNLFNEQPGGPPPGFEPQQARPTWKRIGDMVQFTVGFHLRGGLMLQAEAAAVVEGDARILEKDVPPHWRLATFKIVSAQKRTAPAPARRRPGR